MKIAIIVNPVIPFPPQTIGGTERIVQYLIDELLQKGHEITLLAHNDSKVPNGVKFIPIGTYLDKKYTFLKVWKHLILNNYDVIHNHGRLIYFLPKAWSSVRKVHTFHMADLQSKSFFNFLKIKAKNYVFTPCGKWIQEKHEHLGGKWNYVNNGLPLKLYSYLQKNIDSQSPLVMISRIGEGKGVMTAIELAETCGRKLIIAGKVGDYSHEIEWFENNVKPRCDGDNIKFIGTVNDEQKNILLNEAAALIIPTIDSEAFNTTMIEANACGCPVISYNKFCFKEFIVDGVNGYKAENFEGLIEAVGNINKIDRKKCREEFETHYTSAIMVQNYLKLYKQ